MVHQFGIYSHFFVLQNYYKVIILDLVFSNLNSYSLHLKKQNLKSTWLISILMQNQI